MWIRHYAASMESATLIFGARPNKQVIVELDQGKVRGHRISVFEALNSLRSQNLTVPRGAG